MKLGIPTVLSIIAVCVGATWAVLTFADGTNARTEQRFSEIDKKIQAFEVQAAEIKAERQATARDFDRRIAALLASLERLATEHAETRERVVHIEATQ